ncbi:unnamed protein product [Rhizophagus irregularis]|uniref:Protein kinase domain-containing protein n=1 Tax=Rhizophagus irregularis TaxID=588596 RepID=A0A915Z2G0_9GLOM|nr:unnamed protein product [Rhizophagus irregularis]
MKEIANEIELLHKFNFHKNIIKFFGITKKENWNIKLQFAIQIADAISCIHQKNIIHRDLHSDNILVHQNIIKLADFGLSRRIAEKPKLILEILNGKRETPVSDTPIDYINIYKKCWQNNPDDRPDMRQVFSDLKLINLNTNETEIYEKTVNIIESNIVINNDNSSINDNSLSLSINYSLQSKFDKLIDEYDKMQIEEKDLITNNIKLNENEVIVNELVLLYEEAIQKGIYKNDYIQLIIRKNNKI